MIDRLLSYVAPHRCYGCGLTTSILCHNCEYDIINEDFGRCAWCLRVTTDNNQCRLCANHIGTTATWVVGERSEVLKRLVGDHKYLSAREASQALARLLNARVAILPKDTVVTAVPTIAAHVRQRGFDHAAAVARDFARQRKIGYSPLLKRRLQKSQHELNKAERLRLAQETFRALEVKMPETVLLVDDIVTTGATLQACVAALREAGVKQVYIAVVARQMMK